MPNIAKLNIWKLQRQQFLWRKIYINVGTKCTYQVNVRLGFAQPHHARLHDHVEERAVQGDRLRHLAALLLEAHVGEQRHFETVALQRVDGVVHQGVLQVFTVPCR